jgi:hypothetical protein
MTWTPLPPDAIPDPDTLLGHLEPGPGEGDTAYILPEDLAAIVTALLSIDAAAAAAVQAALTSTDGLVLENRNALSAYIGLVGNPHAIAVHTDLVGVVRDLMARVTALEGAEPPAAVTPDATLLVDKYGGSFLRVRFVQGDYPLVSLPAGANVQFALAPTAGSGGEPFADTAAIRAGSYGATWWDDSGSLGKVTTTAGADISGTALAGWIDEARVARVTSGTDGTHPWLHVEALL